MTRLIDADAIEYHMMAKEDWLGCTVEDSEMVWKVDIDAMPTVDAVPVIRCKDCKYWLKNQDYYEEGSRLFSALDPCQKLDGLTDVTETDYCSKAERKEE